MASVRLEPISGVRLGAIPPLPIAAKAIAFQQTVFCGWNEGPELGSKRLILCRSRRRGLRNGYRFRSFGREQRIEPGRLVDGIETITVIVGQKHT